jgi:Domain of Unknown Function (DUF928)/Trypsin-like peptidase domain
MVNFNSGASLDTVTIDRDWGKAVRSQLVPIEFHNYRLLAKIPTRIFPSSAHPDLCMLKVESLYRCSIQSPKNSGIMNVALPETSESLAIDKLYQWELKLTMKRRDRVVSVKGWIQRVDIEIQAPDGKKYLATSIDGKFDNKYDLALLQFTSETKYDLAKLDDLAGSPIEPKQRIYSAGFPLGTKDLRISRGEISQLTDIPFDDGTQIGYITNKGEKSIQQGMNGGSILDDRQNLLGINTTAITPILRNYIDRDGYKFSSKLNAIYSRANWGIPIYNFLANVNTDLLYEYNLPQVERQVQLTGNLAKLNHQARQMTVRIENSGGTGSGVIIARKGNGAFDRATKINPNFVEIYAALGIAKASLKDYQGALADADRAIKINPKNAFAHIVRCTANSKLGHFQDALLDSDRAIKFIQINDLDRVVVRTNVIFFALFQI